MHREIKFRAWDIDRKVMYYPLDGYQDGQYILHSIDFNGSGVEKITCGIEDDDASDRTTVYPKNFILMQCAVLKDKNKVDIYDGDILTQHKDSPIYFGETKYRVEYIENMAAFVLVGPYNSGGRLYYHPHLSDVALQEFEIIGNVLQNPELLEIGK
jgi:uncharacterized phage protein (TIGR01671 family)